VKKEIRDGSHRWKKKENGSGLSTSIKRGSHDQKEVSCFVSSRTGGKRKRAKKKKGTG
jgi:hypothetical protein